MGNNTVILVLDHMRAKRPYVRTVSKWVQDLDLRGVFVFQRKLILLVLQGHSENIKVNKQHYHTIKLIMWNFRAWYMWKVICSSIDISTVHNLTTYMLVMKTKAVQNCPFFRIDFHFLNCLFYLLNCHIFKSKAKIQS